jgi:hypothetical protein
MRNKPLIFAESIYLFDYMIYNYIFNLRPDDSGDVLSLHMSNI